MTEEQAKIQYGILSGKIDILCLLPLSLNIPFVTAMVPAIAKSKAQGDYKQVKEKISVFLKITMVISLPTTVGLIIYAKPILNLLFPNASNGAILLQINSISVIFMVFAQTINSILQGIGKMNIPAISFFISKILPSFVILNFFEILPKYCILDIYNSLSKPHFINSDILFTYILLIIQLLFYYFLLFHLLMILYSQDNLLFSLVFQNQVVQY